MTSTAVLAYHPCQDSVFPTLDLIPANRPTENVDSTPTVSLIATVTPKLRGSEVTPTKAGAPMPKRLSVRLLLVEHPYVEVLDPVFRSDVVLRCALE